jgi:hypothetical protein
MEHFGFLIAPDAIVPFCLKFGNYSGPKLK